ncbi:Uncharacterised protein [Serratia fonticola]|uniref:Uncharacterized protein n=1 Tax=Serratia fonticola TaxID=47917 RepID=A0A4U9V9J1_SERFO|nr:Uncharacterised protein [Serratia fonticola]
MFGHPTVLPQIAVSGITNNRMAQVAPYDDAADAYAPVSGFSSTRAIARGVIAANRHRHLYRCQGLIMAYRRFWTFVWVGMFIRQLIQLFRQRIVNGAAL